MFCFSIVLSLRRLAKVGPKNGSCEGSAAQDVGKICTTPARESDLEAKIVACRDHFWKLSSTKFAPRLRARAIWKSKLLKLEGFGGLLEVELRKNCTTPARESDLEVKIVKD